MLLVFDVASDYFLCLKQKTAYEMRISDWSSDVCSSDLEGDLERFITARCLNVDKQDLNFDDPHTQSFWGDYCATDRCLHYLHRPGITIDELQIGRASCRERVCQYV